MVPTHWNTPGTEKRHHTRPTLAKRLLVLRLGHSSVGRTCCFDKAFRRTDFQSVAHGGGLQVRPTFGCGYAGPSRNASARRSASPTLPPSPDDAERPRRAFPLGPACGRNQRAVVVSGQGLVSSEWVVVNTCRSFMLLETGTSDSIGRGQFHAAVFGSSPGSDSGSSLRI